MVYQVSAGYSVAGRLIKVPQVFIDRVIRSIIIGITPDLSQVLNVIHHVSTAAPVTQDDVDAVNSLVASWVTTSYNAIYSEHITITAVHTRSMEGLIVPTATAPLSVPGEVTGDILPYFTSLPVEWNTSLTGARNRGSFHVFPASESVNQGDQHPLGSYVTGVETTMGNLITDSASADYPLVVASFRYAAWTPVRTAVVSRKWGTVTHRKAGRGR